MSQKNFIITCVYAYLGETKYFVSRRYPGIPAYNTTNPTSGETLLQLIQTIQSRDPSMSISVSIPASFWYFHNPIVQNNRSSCIQSNQSSFVFHTPALLP
jgi:hypothetical protein